jgi:uncharacterized protein DUF5681
MPNTNNENTTPAEGTAGVSKKLYEVGRGKAPKATRFPKGKSGNPKGRPKKKQEDFDPGKILQAIDNEETAVDGKRNLRKKAEILFQNLFTEAIMESVEAATIVLNYAIEYFGPAAEGPPQIVFVVVPDGCSSPPRGSSRQRKKDPLPVSAGSLFRRIAKHPVKLNGVRMTMWEAYIRQVYEMADRSKRAARLLQQLRKAFPGDAPPGETITFLITEDDANL